ncbi:acetyl-CoA carboxylase biotin carboxyl carrier protein subunit, partial [Parabacteroides sp. OttesenSCG-928-O15]|nr:acetyl-CoA carboxylase biotin carboxyl carrier protein subunit [Parabacteroides sp. OttesenSCG-928-O15]
PNPVLEDCGGVKLAENDKEQLLLELFPIVAKDYLTKVKKERYQKEHAGALNGQEHLKESTKQAVQITGRVITSPMPGRVFQLLVKPGDTLSGGENVLILEAMKMENNISSPYAGKVKQVLVNRGDFVPEGTPMLEIE